MYLLRSIISSGAIVVKADVVTARGVAVMMPVLRDSYKALKDDENEAQRLLR